MLFRAGDALDFQRSSTRKLGYVYRIILLGIITAKKVQPMAGVYVNIHPRADY